MATQNSNQYYPPLTPTGTNNGGWGSEGPGGWSGNAQEPGFGILATPATGAANQKSVPIPGGGQSPWQQGDPTQEQVGALYKQDLGRDMDPSEFQYWASRPDFISGIFNSDEAQAYRNRQTPQAPTGINAIGSSTTNNYSNTSGLSGRPESQQLIDILMKRAQGSLNIDPNTDPVIRPQVDNYAAAQERSRRNAINEQAEAGNPYATGALQNTRTQLTERAGQNTANMQGQLVQNELTSRRKEIQDALSEAGSLLTAQQQISLQRELGMIDAQLKQQQISSGNDQFTAQLGLNAENQGNYWDAIRSGLI